MRLHRFYVSQPLGEEVVIDDISKINQWQKVFRYTSNDLVILFNGDGFDYEYSISTITGKHCTLQRVTQQPSYVPNKKVTLYLSLIKKDLFELVAEKCTELGIRTIVPVITERTQAKNLNMQRLHTVVMEASEQCGRGDIPVIEEPVVFIDAIKKLENNSAYIVFQKGAPSIKELTKKADFLKEKDVAIFIGPEGGWTAEEIDTFRQHDATFASLGETVLRAETAAIVATYSVI